MGSRAIIPQITANTLSTLESIRALTAIGVVVRARIVSPPLAGAVAITLGTWHEQTAWSGRNPGEWILPGEASALGFQRRSKGQWFLDTLITLKVKLLNKK
jgi:hypothetical protein